MGITEPIILDSTGQAIANAINNLQTDLVHTSDIVNNLTSTDTDKPLSANMGKSLNEILKFKVVNASTSGTSSVSLNLSASSSTVLACVELSNNNYFAPVIVSTDGKYYAVIKDVITMSAIGGSKSVSLRVVYTTRTS